MPELDTLRGVAILAVVFYHGFSQCDTTGLPGIAHAFFAATEFGWLGVNLFFVLSGFLITGILLESKGTPRYYKSFYVRRALRILPAYLLLLLLLLLLPRIGIVEGRISWSFVGLSLIYLSNVTNFFGVAMQYGPLWSLAVEEQFYLLWPLLILFLPRKSLVGAIVSAICIGPLFRAGIVLRGGNAWQASVLMPACLDALGMGALVAVLTFIGRDKFKRRLLNASLLLGVALYIGVAVAVHFSHAAAWTVPYGVSVALWSAWLIDGAYSGFGGTMGKVLSFKPAVYLGTISYGVYLIHNFVPDVVNGLFGFTPAHELPMPIRPIIMFLVTVFLASVSWYGFERPINALKRFFPYRPSAAAAATAAAE